MLLTVLLALGFVWAGVLAIVFALCVNAARGDRSLTVSSAPLARPRRFRAVA
jgi:hypothetical protein